MLRIFAILLASIALCSTGASANLVNVSLAPWELDFAADIIRPIIVEALQNFTIPGETQEHFAFWPIHLQRFNISNITFGFYPPVIEMQLRNLTVIIPSTEFELMDRIIFKITCHGHFSAIIDDLSLLIGVDPIRNTNNKFFLTKVTVKSSFGKLNIQHEMDHTLCRIADKILEFFIGNLDQKITSAIINDLPGVLSKAIATGGNAALDKGNYTIVWGPVLTPSLFSFGMNT